MRRIWLGDLFSVVFSMVLGAAGLPGQTGQQTGTATGTTTTGTGSTGTATTTRPPTTTTPTTPTTNNPTTNNQSNFPDVQRPIFLSGRVMMDDGTAPPQSVVIERVCNGSPKPEGYTDSKGNFSFQLGQNANILMDASVASGSDSFGGGFGGQQRSGSNAAGNSSNVPSERQLQNCDLRANLAGYRSENLSLAGRRMMDNPDVGTIILHRLTGVEGFTTSVTSMLAPKDSKKAWEKGRELGKKKKFAEAEKEFRKAVDSYPKYASAWYDLGLTQEAQNNIAGAREAYTKAIVADPKFVKPYVKIYGFDAKEKKWEEVAANSAKVIKMDPYDFPDAFFANAIANLNLQKFDEAEASARAAIKMDKAKQNPKLDHVLGVILVQKQDYAGAIVSLRSFLERAPNDPGVDGVKKQVVEIDRYLAAKVEQAAKEAEPKEQ